MNVHSTQTMKSGQEKLAGCVGFQFADIFSSDDIEYLRQKKSHKGGAGHIVERLLGLPWSTRLLDFADGELKTVKTDAMGHVKEALTVASGNRAVIDDIIDCDRPKCFTSTNVYRKMSRMLMVGICREAADPANWFITFVKVVDFACESMKDFLHELDENWQRVCSLVIDWVDNGQMLEGTGKGPLQLCPHDSKNKKGEYHPMMSAKYGKVSEKKRGWRVPRVWVEEMLSVAA